MYMRLAFSVAAHLDTDILFADEVLAVGDYAFQRKCIDRMRSVAGQGRTVVLVSHDLAAVQRICPVSLLLDAGRMQALGPTAEVVRVYLSRASMTATSDRVDLADAPRVGTGEATFRSVRLSGPGGAPIEPDGPLEVEVEIAADTAMSVASLAVEVRHEFGMPLVTSDSALTGRDFDLAAGINRLRISIRSLHLWPGTYRIGLWVARAVRVTEPIDYVEDAVRLELLPSPGTELIGHTPTHGMVTCHTEYTWLDASGVSDA
jgi:lipopolysaccharide transport system ATP-binding protein